MGITPMEINNKEFKRGFRGYDIDDVDDFLEQVVEDYEKLYKENTALREKLNSLTEKIDHYSKIEATLQNTMLMAQGAADQAKTNAQKEAELIIKNANDTAQKIIDQAHTEAVRITGEYDKIKQEFQVFKSRYKVFIQTQLDLLSDIDTVTTENKAAVSRDLPKEPQPQQKESSLRELQPKEPSYKEPVYKEFHFDQPEKLDKAEDNNIKIIEPVFMESENEVKTPESDDDLLTVFPDKQPEFPSRPVEFNPKTIDFGGRPGFGSNFDDFDDDDNVF
jgi:cell division initiation protein